MVKIGTQRVAGRGQHKAWKDGSQGVMLHECPNPECRHKQNLEENWPRICRVRMTDEKRADDPFLTHTGDFRHHDTGTTAAVYDPTHHYYFGCIRCGAELNRGKDGFEWKHRREDRVRLRHWSFRVSQFAIKAIDISQIVAEWVRAVADPEAMATFLCDRKAMPESTAQKLTPEILERARRAGGNDEIRMTNVATPNVAPGVPPSIGEVASKSAGSNIFAAQSNALLAPRLSGERNEVRGGASGETTRTEISGASQLNRPSSPPPSPPLHGREGDDLTLTASSTVSVPFTAFAGLDTGRRCWFFARAVHAADVKRVLHVEQIPLGNLVDRVTTLFHELGLRALFIDQAPATDEARPLALRLNGLEGLAQWPTAPRDKSGFISLPGGLRWNGARQRWENVRCAVVAFTKRRLGAGITHGFDIFEKGSQTMFVPLIETNRFETIDRVVREFLTPAENVSEVIFAPGQQSYVRLEPAMRLPPKGRGAPLAYEVLDEHLLAGSERVELRDGTLGDYVDACENHFLLADAYSGLAEQEAGDRHLQPPEPIQVFENTRRSRIISSRSTRRVEG
jgi:hypothetical protein